MDTFEAPDRPDPYTPWSTEIGVPKEIKDFENGSFIDAARYFWGYFIYEGEHIQDGDMTMAKVPHEGAYGLSSMKYYSYDTASPPTFTAASSGDGYSYDSYPVEKVGRVSYSSEEEARLTERFGYNCSSVSKGEYTDVEEFLEHVFDSCYNSHIDDLIQQVQVADTAVRYLFKQVDVVPFQPLSEISEAYQAAETAETLAPSTMASSETGGGGY